MQKTKHCYRAVTFCALVLLATAPNYACASSCKTSTGSWEKMQEKVISLQTGSENSIQIKAKIANDEDELLGGYQWLCQKDVKDSAILFAFKRPFNAPFHMKNVFVPLDIFFFDHKGKLLHSDRMDAEPPGSDLPEKVYQPDANDHFQYVLEMPVSADSQKLKTISNLQLMIR